MLNAINNSGCPPGRWVELARCRAINGQHDVHRCGKTGNIPERAHSRRSIEFLPIKDVGSQQHALARNVDLTLAFERIRT